ncbi:MAG TPA: hypothetical protein P5186_09470 [Candidatus Paceibacterota bacterium]|nr:hypothetical protein [Verrucomicrobiota bacterium]HRY48264.1 hypothetical protein [Candidatus Paceibacterota bacterium]
MNQDSKFTGSFPTTHWSVVLAAGHPSSPNAEAALAELCRLYWPPLYVFARRLGHAPEDAQDLTQGFFEHLLRVQLTAKADAAKGKFRSFLLGAFKRFIGSEEARTRAQKRGGGKMLISCDVPQAEMRFLSESMTHLSPEVLFDRYWALSMFEETLRLLETEFRQFGRAPLFDQLHPFLQGEANGLTYADAARNLGTTEGTIRVTVSRMRQRYRELLRSVLAMTLDSPHEVDDELEHLRAALRA